jgi:hypothetical protein
MERAGFPSALSQWAGGCFDGLADHKDCRRLGREASRIKEEARAI